MLLPVWVSGTAAAPVHGKLMVLHVMLRTTLELCHYHRTALGHVCFTSYFSASSLSPYTGLLFFVCEQLNLRVLLPPLFFCDWGGRRTGADIEGFMSSSRLFSTFYSSFFFLTLVLSSFWTSRGHRCCPFFPLALAFNCYRA